MKPLCGWLAALAGCACLGAATEVGPDEFAELARQIQASQQWDQARLARETRRPEALILEVDRTPVDVVWRRTSALLADLRVLDGAPDLSGEEAALAELRAEVEALRSQVAASEVDQRALFRKLTALRRAISFKNPLLDFDAIVFLKHNKQVRGHRHMVDQYLGFNAQKAGGAFVLEEPFGPAPRVRSVLGHAKVVSGRLEGRVLENQGAFISLDLDYDGQTILFAFSEAEHEIPPGASFAEQYWRPEEIFNDRVAAHHYFRPESTYHIFRAQVDGTGLRQLTDGCWNDFDPCFLPNGRIAFISERAGGQVRCGMRPLPSGTLHAMMPDGSDMIQLSWHDTQEWHPSVDNHGLIAYTRWDYVDRDSDVAHHLWLCTPDGRDPRSPHGNYPDQRELRPWMEMSIRAIPGSHKYVAVAAPHHGEAYGSLVLIDVRQPEDRGTAQLERVTPEVPFPESESAPGVPHAKGKHDPLSEVYGTPWPLSEDYFLAVYDPGQRNYGIYLIDTFGNRELLYRDPAIACLDPIPLRPRARPVVLPTATLQAQADREPEADLSEGTVAVMNVYASHPPLPPGTTIKELRVINLFPKDNPFQDAPNIGAASQSLARGVLGVAPVEADGSAYFRMPAGAPVYFQLLDEQGLAVQTMRSDTYVHPGEHLSCVGCHANRHGTPKMPGQAPPMALRRPPSALRPEAPGAYPLTFPRLVQPVLDTQCVECHDNEPEAPSLRGDRLAKFGWSEAFHTLRPLAWGKSGGNGIALKERQYSIPGQEGARVSKLYQLLAAGHYDVRLTPEQRRRITLWLDCNSNFYGAYTDVERQARGEVVRPIWGVPRWSDFEALVGPGPEGGRWAVAVEPTP
ncbi:MAG: hypothetical protein FJ387_08920 [Verrucomicrobia bacterium]|nr:hypothetical protein [Verrucomicrobiota bacterium]